MSMLNIQPSEPQRDEVAETVAKLEGQVLILIGLLRRVQVRHIVTIKLREDIEAEIGPAPYTVEEQE